MKHILTYHLLFVLFISFASTATPELADEPSPRLQSYSWMSLEQWHAKHQDDVNVANTGKAQLLFLGDSITEGWSADIWNQHFAKYDTANFGIGGDKTQNLLWRLQNGAAGKLQPKVIVLMIGVNNFGHDNASEKDVLRGVTAILDETKTRFPKAKTVLLGILPYGEMHESYNRERVKNANQLLSSLSEERGLIYRDYGALFVNSDGHIPRELMADLLHPTQAGYKLLASKLAPLIDSLMPAADLLSLANKRIHIEGRSHLNSRNELEIGYPGVNVAFTFRGQNLSLLASSSNGKNLLDVYIDGEFEKTIEIQKAAKYYALLENQKRKTRKIELSHRSETWHGLLNLKGLDLHKGKLKTPPKLPKRKMLFIGDSITCGEALLREPVCKKTFAWWDPKNAYGKRLASELDAQSHLVCFGGRGLTRSWNGKTDEQNAPDFFNAAIATGENAPAWDHSQYSPDLVFIALGTNDFSLGIGALPDETHFVNTYIDFIKKIQRVHSSATIVITEGPMVNDEADPTRPQKTVLQQYLQKVVQSSEGKVHYISSQTHPGDSCDAHPTAAQHAHMANEYTPKLKKLMRW